MFKDVSTKLAFPELEERILDYWRENDIFQKSMKLREGQPQFVFLEGPPTANGRPGVHHILARVMKDVICRYKTMQGNYVYRKAGWDTHGLPVEIEVEKKLGISGKPQIEEYGVREFVEKCKESVFTYEKDWREITERIGFWVDIDHPYITLENEYIESVWWSLKKFWEAGLLYQGHKVVPYCPRCGTALSSHEVAQGYNEIEEPSIYVKCKVKNKENTSLLIWTTTPWTLPSNVALAVNKDFEYVKVEYENENIILAKERLSKVFGIVPEIKEIYRGSELAGWEYEPLFDFADLDKKAYYVVEADFVTLDEGTGIVHMAPAFGQDDYEIGKEHDLPLIQLVDLEGRFVPEAKPYAGMFVKEADPEITKELDKRGLLFKEEDYTHDYPFCWRCDTPLLYYARASWFIKTTEIKDKLIEKNNEINWYPEHIKTGRFGNWLENNVDWAISRERYWGTPLNIWQCQECEHEMSIGSIAELKEYGKDVPDDIELHKPYIDEVKLECPKCSNEMQRVEEVIDCWYDSGCAHTAQWHYPFENEEKLNSSMPVDFISEAIDQTRGWFYSLLVTGAFLYDVPTYKNCLCLELVLGSDGQKMSKSRGNATNPWLVLDNEGADAIRWYFYTVSPPWNPRIFSEEAVRDTLKNFLGTFYNVYGFFVLYANVDEVNPKEFDIPAESRPLMDRWLISRFNSVAKEVQNSMDDYQITTAARAIDDFVDELSNWYVRRNRDRFWGAEMSNDKKSAYLTLYEILIGTAKLLAPFTPFIAEEVYRNLADSVDENPEESVHLCTYPEPQEELIDKELETDMELIKRLIGLGRAARNQADIKIRQPLSSISIGVQSDDERGSVLRFVDLIKDELNIKEVQFSDNVEEFAKYTIKPNFKLLGPKYGKAVKNIAKAISELDDTTAAKRELTLTDQLKVEVGDVKYTLSDDELEVETESQEGFAVETDNNYFVAIDTRLTHELVLEGFARELVNKIQLMRKEADFNVADRIKLSIQSTDIVHEAFDTHRDYVTGETLTIEVVDVPGPGAFVKEWKVNSEKAVISVEQV